MRHWLWLTIALSGALAPTTVLAQDEDEEASDKADKKGAKSEEGEGDDEGDAEAKAKAEAEAKAQAELEVEDPELAAFNRGEDPDAKPKKKKSKAKPPPPKDEAVGGVGVSAGVLVGWGFQPWFHLAAGLRAGVNIGEIYVGATGVYAFGQTLEDKSRVAGYTFKDSGNYMLFGGEVGYDADLGDFSVRPFLGLGFSRTPRESCDPSCRADTGTHLYLAPGATLLYPIDPVFVGLDARYNVVLGLTDGSGAMVSATAGLAF